MSLPAETVARFARILPVVRLLPFVRAAFLAGVSLGTVAIMLQFQFEETDRPWPGRPPS